METKAYYRSLIFLITILQLKKIDEIKQKMFIHPDQFSTSDSKLPEKMVDRQLPKYSHVFKQIVNQ